MARRVIAAMAFLLVACAPPPGEQPASAPKLNVSGVLDRGGFSPTCPTGEPCDPAPFANALIFTSTSGEQTRINVKPDGQFAVHLDAGAYTIAAVPPPYQARVVPSTAQVPVTGAVFLSLRITD